jgi:hypothetical protein
VIFIIIGSAIFLGLFLIAAFFSGDFKAFIKGALMTAAIIVIVSIATFLIIKGANEVYPGEEIKRESLRG